VTLKLPRLSDAATIAPFRRFGEQAALRRRQSRRPWRQRCEQLLAHAWPGNVRERRAPPSALLGLPVFEMKLAPRRRAPLARGVQAIGPAHDDAMRRNDGDVARRAAS
jgi:hypothetical protein